MKWALRAVSLVILVTLLTFNWLHFHESDRSLTDLLGDVIGSLVIASLFIGPSFGEPSLWRAFRIISGRAKPTR